MPQIPFLTSDLLYCYGIMPNQRLPVKSCVWDGFYSKQSCGCYHSVAFAVPGPAGSMDVTIFIVPLLLYLNYEEENGTQAKNTKDFLMSDTTGGELTQWKQSMLERCAYIPNQAEKIPRHMPLHAIPYEPVQVQQQGTSPNLHVFQHEVHGMIYAADIVYPNV